MKCITNITILLLIIVTFKCFALSTSIPEVKKGVINLNNIDLKIPILPLNGEWEFYWKHLYEPKDFVSSKLKPDTFIAVPGSWTNLTIKGKRLENTGFATFRLKIHSESNSVICLSIKEIVCAYNLWVNGIKITQVGKVGTSKETSSPAIRHICETFNLQEGNNEIIIQVSNFAHSKNSFECAPEIGEPTIIQHRNFNYSSEDIIVIGCLLILVFYHLGLFIFRPGDYFNLVFVVFCLLAISRILVSTNFTLGEFIPNVKWDYVYFIRYFSEYSLIPTLSYSVQLSIKEKSFKNIFRFIYILSALSLITLLFPLPFYSKFVPVYEVMAGIYSIVITSCLIGKHFRSGQPGVRILLFSILVLTIIGINDMLYLNDKLNTRELFPLGIFIFSLGQSLTIARRYSYMYQENEDLIKILNVKNQNLSKKISEQVNELQQKKEMLEQNNLTLQKYYTALEQTHAAIVITDIKGCIEYVNPGFERITGYSGNEVIGKEPNLLKSGKTLNLTYIDMWDKLLSGNVWYGEFINKKKNQEEYFEKVIISPVRNQAGQICNYIKIAEDVTKIKEIEQELIRSNKLLQELLDFKAKQNTRLNEQLNQLYENSFYGIAFFELSDNSVLISSCNKLWSIIAGIERKELIGKKFADHENYGLIMINDLIINSIESNTIQTAYRQLNNREYFLRVVPVAGKEKIIRSCVVFCMDETNRIEAERKRHESDEKFFRIFHDSVNPIMILSEKLEIIDKNKSASAYFENFDNRSIGEKIILENEYAENVAAIVPRLRKGEKIIPIECKILNNNKVLVPFELTFTSFYLNNEFFILAILHDISEQKMVERKIVEASVMIENRERKKLAFDLHDKIGPLVSSVALYLSVLSREKNITQASIEIIHKLHLILKETNVSIREIINNLNPGTLKQFGLETALISFFESKRMILNVAFDCSIPDIRLPEPIEIMLYNIVLEAFNNTIKHSGANLVNVRIHKENNYIYLTYSDNGSGFDFDKQQITGIEKLGLHSIISRVKSVDGQCNIKTSPANGFGMSIKIPL